MTKLAKFVCKYLFREEFAYVTKYKYIKRKGDQQSEISHYRDCVVVPPFLENIKQITRLYNTVNATYRINSQHV